MSADARSRGARALLGCPNEFGLDAIFAINDLTALSLLQVLVLGGVQVLHDITLIGYDD